MRSAYPTQRAEAEPDVAGKLLQPGWLALGAALALGGAGIATLYSIAGGSLAPWADRQILRLVVGLGLLLVALLMPLRLWLRLAWPAYVVCLVLLVAVAILGTPVMGARRWLQAGALSIQPAETMKIAVVLVLARFYHGLDAGHVSRPLAVALPLALIALPAALIARQPDLGSALMVVGAGLGVMLLAGVSLGYAVAALVGAIAAGPFLWERLHDYQRRRIATFLDPDHDPLGAGYHILQSRIALGSGGIDGRGWLQGLQPLTNMLPEAETDFILAAFGEEWGLVGCLALLALYGVLVATLLAAAIACRSRFARLLTGGVAVGIGLPALVNVAMVTGAAPVVGIPLPFVSYGGSALLSSLVALGLALCALANRRLTLVPDPSRLRL